MQEGSKSQFFDPTALWLLGDWLLSPGAVGVRGMVVVEVARMIDAWAAGMTRKDIQDRCVDGWGCVKTMVGVNVADLIQMCSPIRLGASVASLLVPLQPKEDEAQKRAAVLLQVRTPQRGTCIQHPHVIKTIHTSIQHMIDMDSLPLTLGRY